MKVVEAVLWAPRPKQSLAWSQRTQYSNNELELEIRQYCFKSTGAVGTIRDGSPESPPLSHSSIVTPL